MFKDLRTLRPGEDCSLEETLSPFLDFLWKNVCCETPQKQKVYYWYSVPHDQLFMNALERDLRREKMGLEPTTVAVNEPALSYGWAKLEELGGELPASIGRARL